MSVHIRGGRSCIPSKSKAIICDDRDLLFFAGNLFPFISPLQQVQIIVHLPLHALILFGIILPASRDYRLGWNLKVVPDVAKRPDLEVLVEFLDHVGRQGGHVDVAVASEEEVVGYRAVCRVLVVAG
jgi:hypothetical protein